MTPVSVLTASAATLTAVLWAVLFISGGSRYDDIIMNQSVKKYKLRCLFFIGFEVMRLLKININDRVFSHRKSRITELYGSTYSEFYTYVTAGAQLTYALTALPAGLAVSAAALSLTAVIMTLMTCILLFIYIDYDIRKKVSEKREAIVCELPDIISRLTLLINAGMVLREAWISVSSVSDSPLCKEMKYVSSEIRNGISDINALDAFADKCQTKQVRKFANTLSQNIQKGNSELAALLRQLADELWEDKKNIVRQKGEAVNQKLLFPMLLIFTAIIIMVIVPVFTNIK